MNLRDFCLSFKSGCRKELGSTGDNWGEEEYSYSDFYQAFSMAPREAPTPTQLMGMPHNCSIALM
jgi:hypothetical protein